jgi:hypothetical protein
VSQAALLLDILHCSRQEAMQQVVVVEAEHRSPTQDRQVVAVVVQPRPCRVQETVSVHKLELDRNTNRSLLASIGP